MRALLFVLLVAYVSARTMCTRANLNLRRSPGGSVLGVLRSGESVNVISSSGGWSRINHRLGTGYASSSYLSSCGSSSRSRSRAVSRNRFSPRSSSRRSPNRQTTGYRSRSRSRSSSNRQPRQSSFSNRQSQRPPQRSQRPQRSPRSQTSQRPPQRPQTQPQRQSRPTRGGGGGSGICSTFNAIWNAYPPDEVLSENLLRTLGFGSWITNTCAIRTTLALNAAGYRPGDVSRARWTAKGKRYLIRVLEMNQFMLSTFGRPYAVGGIGSVNSPPQELVGKSGLIRWSDCGFSDATGHFDVWNGNTLQIKGHGYFGRCKRAEVWNVCNPIPNPNYSTLLSHMRRTGGCSGC